MAKFFLVCFLLLSFESRANLFDFGTNDKGQQSSLPALIEKMKNLKMKDDPSYEDTFNQMVKVIEDGVEGEKLYCSGEAQNSKGETLPAAQKQFCMRELKKHYLEAISTIFDMKKKYLNFIHERQVEKLSEIQKSLKAEIEKKF
jgi:hypothetical protein